MNNNSNILNLENLIDLSNILLNSTNEKFIFDTILLSIMGKFGIKRGIVFLQKSSKSKYYNVISSRGRTQYSHNISAIPIEDISLDNSLISDFYLNKFEFKNENGRNFIILLSEKLNKIEFTEEENKYLHLVAKIAQSALKNAFNNYKLEETKHNLEKRNQILNTLFEITQDYSIVNSYEEIFRMFSHRLMGQLMVSKFSMYYLKENEEIEQCINRFKNNLSIQLLNYLINYLDSPTDLNDLNISSENLLNEITKNEIQLFVPMYHNNIKKGFILLSKKMNNEKFSNDNINFLQALASATISTMENHRLINELIEKKNIENELNLALEIQNNLLPKSELNYKNYSLSGISKPSQQVGGDYLDYFVLSNGNIVFTIADVSGKGLPASLLMANVQAAFRALSMVDFDLYDLLNNLNKIVFQNTSPDKFVTMFVGIINPDENILTYINAGHNPPLHLKENGDVDELKEGGLFLGMLDDQINYSIGKINLEKNDIICLFTDGICETPNLNGEEYGIERIIESIKSNLDFNSTNMINKLLENIILFSKSDLPYDDQTILIIKRLK